MKPHTCYVRLNPNFLPLPACKTTDISIVQACTFEQNWFQYADVVIATWFLDFTIFCSIYPSPEPSSSSTVQVPVANNTGSLPNLTNMNLQSTLDRDGASTGHTQPVACFGGQVNATVQILPQHRGVMPSRIQRQMVPAPLVLHNSNYIFMENSGSDGDVSWILHCFSIYWDSVQVPHLFNSPLPGEWQALLNVVPGWMHRWWHHSHLLYPLHPTLDW